MYTIFEQLCQANNISQYQVSKATGIPQSTLSTWKKRGTDLSSDKMQIIADFFNVSLEYLVSGRSSSDVPSNDVIEINDHDLKMIEQYNALDTSGKKMVDQTLLIQYERVMTETNKIILLHEDPAQYGTLAAHKKEDASIDDTTDDIKKMAQKVEGLKKGNNEQLRDSSTDLC